MHRDEGVGRESPSGLLLRRESEKHGREGQYEPYPYQHERERPRQPPADLLAPPRPVQRPPCKEPHDNGERRLAAQGAYWRVKLHEAGYALESLGKHREDA